MAPNVRADPAVRVTLEPEAVSGADAHQDIWTSTTSSPGERDAVSPQAPDIVREVAVEDTDQTADAAGSGKRFEEHVASALGQLNVRHRTQRTLRSPAWGGGHRVDHLVWIEGDPSRCFVVSDKYQSGDGTAEEKIPCEILKLDALVHQDPGLNDGVQIVGAAVVTAGAGFNAARLDFFETCIERLSPAGANRRPVRWYRRLSDLLVAGIPELGVDGMSPDAAATWDDGSFADTDPPAATALQLQLFDEL
jgi:hypothetical protein